MYIKAIIASNNKGVIGDKNSIPWHSLEDLQHFKNMTMNCAVLAGFNTKQTLPKLEGRSVFIDDIKLSPEQNLTEINLDEIWIIGGKKTYDRYMHLIDEIHISHIDDNSEGDTKHPNYAALKKEAKFFNYYFKTNK